MFSHRTRTPIAFQLQNRGAYSPSKSPSCFRVTNIIICSTDGSWTTFTGDQLGIVFANRIFELYKASGADVSKLAMVASTVSSRMVQKMAEVEGFNFTECLTGRL
jgi:hypothetical protein